MMGYFYGRLMIFSEDFVNLLMGKLFLYIVFFFILFVMVISFVYEFILMGMV